MTTLLLAPYNASMRMGQGYNSFLQISCLDDAVRITESSLKPQPVRARNKSNVSQTVSYSSRFVERISEFTGNMNISAASSIKTGIIEVLGNSISLDQAKFFASDLNVEVGVKVVNRFLEGGDLHAIVSIKILDATKKSEIESTSVLRDRNAS
ncbi:uncharacterized protein N7443_007328 [Penicillium atrosanguineum]|uniref:uncharacterized protein n=1 Tax=Penicillium atrosanguineum TaxID=1132637 RepID=UPI002389A858|nr:uncharacterized protein N7443_007328 [Penicillium atrosanguineum]KAJ5296435.1 hypothetical protein N7443_007328 [Penicillium atrosanguineum]